MTLEIVLLAMIAAFLGLRLYSVLGKRTGHEQEPPLPRRIEKPEGVVPPREAPAPAPDIPREAPAALPEMVYESHAEDGVRAILAADRNFDVGRFVEGAKSAYGMVLEAYWKGDKQELAELCDKDVYESFAAAIDERDEKGETLDNRLVRIEEARIVDAVYEAPEARVTMRFDADIAAVLRDKDGNLIGGSLSDAVETNDIWTFARDTTSPDPNWLLVQTDQA